jgi:predicted pyridoxine 5'-phosphate oxidase superfamily flavin-nucleotide-binding protein
MSEITNIEQLETIFSQPSLRAKNKVMTQIDCYAQTLIENSHFAILSTCDHIGFTDLSPKGGAPGFIKLTDNSTLLIPESSGNNRVDSLRNIIDNPKVGLLFMVNGIDEVLRGLCCVIRSENQTACN